MRFLAIVASHCSNRAKIFSEWEKLHEFVDRWFPVGCLEDDTVPKLIITDWNHYFWQNGPYIFPIQWRKTEISVVFNISKTKKFPMTASLSEIQPADREKEEFGYREEN